MAIIPALITSRKHTGSTADSFRTGGRLPSELVVERFEVESSEIERFEVESVRPFLFRRIPTEKDLARIENAESLSGR